ncbi:MAG: GTP 3',8-cyclase MoaA [Firmicutes bacterium]|nr:GTP 3',8-cyclase MoaA [Bacillota bacterium]
MRDHFNREINYLRLSVTDLCNLRCAYCMPAEGVVKRAHADILRVEEIGEIVRACAACGITKVRLTGGEPLVRRGIVDICRLAAATEGIREVCMTTNGVLLPEYAQKLRDAGLRRVNISLDSLNPETYRGVSRRDELSAAERGLEAALGAGFDAVKVNAVLMAGINDGEIAKLAALTRRGVDVRFIELMPVGERAAWNREHFLENSAVLKALPELIPAGAEGVATYYRLPSASGRVGLISPVSAHFCPDCNRIRVTSDGKLKPCLHAKAEINLRGLRGAALEETVRAAIGQKPERHALERGVSESGRNMNEIGG